MEARAEVKAEKEAKAANQGYNDEKAQLELNNGVLQQMTFLSNNRQ